MMQTLSMRWGSILILLLTVLNITATPLYGETLRYFYDTSYRLQKVVDEETAIATIRTYDALGNRLVKTVAASGAANNPPEVPGNLIPADNTTGLPATTLTLSWSCNDPDGGDLLFYDVYLDTSSNPAIYTSGLVSSSITIDKLQSNTTYFWQIIARDNKGAHTAGPVLSFTVTNHPPTTPVQIFPNDGEYVPGKNLYLHWQPSTDSDPVDTVIYDLYFDTSPSPALFLEGFSQNSCRIGDLEYDTTYYWRVVARDSSGGVSTSSPVWSFTTLAADHYLSGVIFSTDTTLRADRGMYIISGMVDVSQGVTLTLEPGTVLKFGMSNALSINGTLNAVGTAEAPIVFTSTKDDSQGGDTNFDMDATFPAPGDWHGIIIHNETADDSQLIHCLIQYAGANDNHGALFIDNCSPRISHSTIRFSLFDGIRINAGDPEISHSIISDNGRHGISLVAGAPEIADCIISNNSDHGIFVEDGSPTITDCTLSGNGKYGIAVDAGTPTISGCTITENLAGGIYIMSGTPAVSGNTITGAHPFAFDAGVLGRAQLSDNIFIDAEYFIIAGGEVQYDTTLPALSFNYLITGSITVAGTDGPDAITTLTLAPGVILHFSMGTYLQIGTPNDDPGALDAQGTLTQKITFTSTSSDPTFDNWSGIRFFNTNSFTGSTMHHCLVQHVKNNTDAEIRGAIFAETLALSVKDTEIRNNTDYGIFIRDGEPAISATTIIDNSDYGIYLENGGAEIDSCTITGNQTGGILVANGSPHITDNTITGNMPLVFYPDGVAGSIISGNVLDAGIDYLTILGGTLSLDALWLPGEYRLRFTGNLIVGGMDSSDGITTLTLEAGLGLYFEESCYLYIGGSSSSPGAIIATGTATEPIVFTSFGTAAWRGIRFNPSASPASSLKHCIVEKTSNLSSAITIYDASPTISNSIVQNGGSTGVSIVGGSPTLIGVTIRNNAQYGLLLSDCFARVETATIIDNTSGGVYFHQDGGATITNSTINGATPFACSVFGVATGSRLAGNTLDPGANHILMSGGTINENATWVAAGLPYIITGDITVYGDSSAHTAILTIEPGTQLLFSGQYSLLQIGKNTRKAALIARGTEERPIVFSSSEDEPQERDWKGILFTDTTDDTTIMEHCIIEYAGYVYLSGGIEIDAASPTIMSTTVRHCGSYGIEIISGQPLISYCAIIGCNTGIYIGHGNSSDTPITINFCSLYNNRIGIKVGSSATEISGITIRNCAFSQNSDWALEVYDYSDTKVDARHNYWGNVSEPGEVIDGPADYTPWLTDPPDTNTRGDLNNNHLLDLSDLILSLQTSAGQPVILRSKGDADGDGLIGPVETLYIINSLTSGQP